MSENVKSDLARELWLGVADPNLAIGGVQSRVLTPGAQLGPAIGSTQLRAQVHTYIFHYFSLKRKGREKEIDTLVCLLPTVK